MVSLPGMRRKTTAIGLDIGDCGVRAVQLWRCGQTYHTMRTACLETQPPADADKNDYRDRRVHNCIRQAEFKGRTARTALSQPDADFFSLDLPEVKSSELEQIASIEINRLLAGKYNRVQSAHWRLPPGMRSAPNALGVASSYDKVVEAVSMCGDAGLRCVRVDAAATALARLGSTLHSFSADEVWGVLDVGHRQSRLILCLENIPVLVRTVGSGGGELTKRITQSLGTSSKTAEVHKRDHGIALSGRGTRDGGCLPESELASVLISILRGDLNGLAAEIKRSYDYVLSCYPGRRACDLMLVGGGAAMHNLPEYLADLLGITVARASRYLDDGSCDLRYASAKKNTLEASALAIGLAIGG